MGNRIVAILLGIAIMVSLERWAGFQWYSALLLGAVGYGIVRYVAYFARERRYIKDTMDAARRGQIPS
jgi:hypothetical protein